MRKQTLSATAVAIYVGLVIDVRDDDHGNRLKATPLIPLNPVVYLLCFLEWLVMVGWRWFDRQRVSIRVKVFYTRLRIERVFECLAGLFYGPVWPAPIG
jgi:hypothetical protein